MKSNQIQVETAEQIMYNVRDIQRVFNIGRNKAYSLMHSKGFPTIVINGSILAPRREVEKWIQNHIGKAVYV